jgi:hypothetical protein
MSFAVLLGMAAIPAGASDLQTNLDHAVQTLTAMQRLLDAIDQRHQAAIAGLPAAGQREVAEAGTVPTPPLPAGSAPNAAGFIFINLAMPANQTIADDLGGVPGNNLKNVPQGEQKLGISQFYIGDRLLHLRGKDSPQLPDRVTGIPLNTAFTRLHVLQSTVNGSGNPSVADGTEIGAYLVHYADGSSEKIPIVYAQDVRDWWDSDAPAPAKVQVMWTGTNPAADQRQRKIRVFVNTWNNPHPDRQATTLDYVSDDTVCEPFLVALSVEK